MQSIYQQVVTVYHSVKASRLYTSIRRAAIQYDQNVGRLLYSVTTGQYNN